MTYWPPSMTPARASSAPPHELFKDPYVGAIDMIRSGRGVGASLFSNAATVQDGATTEWITKNQGVIVLDDREIIVDGSILNESSLGATICNDKALTKNFLSTAGVRTPRGRVARSPADAVLAAEELPGGVVVKPVGGGMGRGVTVGAKGEREIQDAYRLAAGPKRRRVLVEEMIDTESEYRCMATRQECVSVIERVLPAVIGDGVSTVRELVRRKNEHRAQNPALHNLPIPLDRVVDSVLRRQGLGLDSVPARRQEVLVRNVGGLSGGGEPIDRFDQVSQDVKSLAHHAIGAIPSLTWGGVDVIIERHTGVPFVVEINTQAGYGAATFPTEGTARDVASVAWRERRATVKPDAPKCGETLIAPFEPRPLSAIGLIGYKAAAKSTFANFFFAWLSSNGYRVDNSHVRVVKVSKGGSERWFRNNGASGSDLLAAHRVVRRHFLVRQLLARKGVPRARGRLVRDVSEFERFFKDKGRRFVAVPKFLKWGHRQSVHISGEEAHELLGNRRSWVVQSYPVGNRVTVFATRCRALVALHRTGGQPVDGPTMEAACNVAIEAVRAIPELRWATVDLVATEPRSDIQGLPPVLVEGMNINRVVSGTETVIAGDMEDAYRYVLGQ